MRLKLTGKTGKGKNRVREHGEFWLVDAPLVNQVHFSTSSIGPFALIHSEKTGDSRWVGLTEDQDFVVEEIL